MIGVPIGLLTAIFMAKFCPKKLFKWLMQNPGAHTCTDIKAGMPDVYGEIVIMQVGSDAKSLAEENELIVREVIEGKNCYRYAGE